MCLSGVWAGPFVDCHRLLRRPMIRPAPARCVRLARFTLALALGWRDAIHIAIFPDHHHPC